MPLAIDAGTRSVTRCKIIRARGRNATVHAIAEADLARILVDGEDRPLFAAPSEVRLVAFEIETTPSAANNAKKASPL